ncbi:BQ5605_C004g02943 [Microbotryum silenes-dioicae]|uniref:BQ5605_C004g02943 protein n=1 Tax=Microbotryum silenes-dioicae TaxID=796604 RepID=A0A2X0M9C3_9BASI|nr:BQ5605_C004g02943 [Microbotryum silenes-dioicae]
MPGPKAAPSTSKLDSLETVQQTLQQQVPQLFGASQHSVASHRKNINTLHGLFLRAAQVTTLSNDGTTLRLTGEKAFGDAFRAAVVHPLGVKKGVEQADRIIKYIAGFVGFAVEHDFKQREAEAGEQDDDEDEDGPASRLVAQLLAFLLKGFQAKNKVARFRSVQLVALMVNSLGEIDDDTYQLLKQALLERVRDKESTVRMQAVVALAKLQEADEVDEDDDDELSVSDVLIDVLTHDPAAEVRRAALFNLIPSPKTLPALLMRTLDVDPINRRAAYLHVLYEIPCARLTQTQREDAIARGLRDREEGVRRAAKKLVSKWAEDAGGVVRFLEFFDLYEGKAAENILSAIFDSNPALMEGLDFGGDFWQILTPHTAFTTRVYLNHLRQLEDPRLADLEPVVTALAFFVQNEWTKLVVSLDAAERDEGAELELEFVVGELVEMAIDLDYGDEIGRRKIFELMREMMSNSILPYSLVPKCLDVLLKVTSSEKEFMRIVVEIVQSLRADSHLMTTDDDADLDNDSEDEDEDEGVEARKARRKRRYTASQEPVIFARRKQLDLRCLVIVKALLERVMGVSLYQQVSARGEGGGADFFGGLIDMEQALQENSMLHGLVTELVVPAIKQKDQEVRSSGLVCLGLISLLDKPTAVDSFELLARQSQDTEGELRVKILQTLFDLLVLHGINLGADRGFGADVILGFLMSSLEQEEPEAEATCVIGVCKLMLSNLVTDEVILSRLVLLYFASETIDNQKLRQCLSYFFPVYAYSNPANQRRVSKVFLPTLALLKDVYDELGTTERNAMVAPLQIGLQLLDWTDPQKSILAAEDTKASRAQLDETIHLDLSVQMIKALFQQTLKDERKLLCQLLPKLYIPLEAPGLKVKALLWLIKATKSKRALSDTVSKNALERFEKMVVKTCEEQVNEVDEEAWQASAEFADVRDFVKTNLEGVQDEEASQEDEAESAAEQSEEEEEAVALPVRRAPAPQADDEDEEEEEDDE